MKKKVIIIAIVICILVGIAAFVMSEREDEEIQFIAVVTEVDTESNTAYASYAARLNSSNKSPLTKDFPEDIVFDTSNLDVVLKKDDVITAYCLASSIAGNRVEVYNLTVSEPVQ